MGGGGWGKAIKASQSRYFTLFWAWLLKLDFLKA